MLNTLKPGLNEKAYENALVIEQIKPGHAIEQQRRFDVLYEGQLVDTLIPNLLVDGLVVVIHKGGFRFHENPPYPDDGLLRHHRLPTGTALQLQILRPSLETSCNLEFQILPLIRDHLFHPWSKTLPNH